MYPPKVFISLAKIDAVNPSSTKFSIQITSIQNKHLEVRAFTWDYTKIHVLDIEWIAFGK